MAAYGTLDMDVEPAREKRSYNKVVAGVVAMTLVTVSVVALSSSAASFASPNAVVDANRNRATIGKVDPGVRELGMDVLNMTISGLRWGIFGFNSDKTVIIPLTAGKATADWEKDFKMFKNALPEKDAAVAVYNFEYWVDDLATSTEPIMITWAPFCDRSDPNRPTGACNGLSDREEARAGYYLPSIILMLNTDEGRLNTEKMPGKFVQDGIGKHKKGMEERVPVDMFSGPYRLEAISESYYGFCTEEMGLEPKLCSLERQFHNCPFESEDETEWSDSNPCQMAMCAGDEFTRPEGALPETISQGCCDYIENTFCADPSNVETMGCHSVTLAAIDKLCEIPKPGMPVILEETWSEMAQCTADCIEPCPLIQERAGGDASQTWKKCEGCQNDMMPDENGQISQCYPGAYGYESDTCCGNALTEDGAFMCEQDANLSSQVCNMLEYWNCKWMPQADCPEEKRAQDIADSATGCCYTAGEGADLFGTDADMSLGEVPEVLCGGGKYANADDATVFAGADVTCDAQMAIFQAALDEYLASIEPAVGTTTAAARV